MLTHCTLYKVQGNKLRRELQGPLTLGLMLGTKKGIQLTIQLLKKTNISTKEWHRSNMELGKEEEEERVPYQSIRNSRVEGHVLVAVPRSP